jgi:hypothetical protein
MAKDIRKFRTYGQESRRDYADRVRERKVTTRVIRIQALYDKQNIAADVPAGARF